MITVSGVRKYTSGRKREKQRTLSDEKERIFRSSIAGIAGDKGQSGCGISMAKFEFAEQCSHALGVQR
jgi:hypothetical protein